RSRAELGEAQRGRVARVPVADRAERRLDGGGRGREGAVADLELDDVLALALEPLGHGQHGEGGLDADGRGEVAEGEGHGRQHPREAGRAQAPVAGYHGSMRLLRLGALLGVLSTSWSGGPVGLAAQGSDAT